MTELNPTTDLDEPITIVRGPMPDLDDEDGTPLHLWAVQGGIDTMHVGVFAMLATLHKDGGAAPEEIGEINQAEFNELARRPGDDPKYIQAAVEELQQRHLLIRRDGRWLFSQLAAVLYSEGHDDETVRQQVEAAVASWLQEHAA